MSHLPVPLLALSALAAACLARADAPAPAPRAALDRYYADRLGRPFIRRPDAPALRPPPPPWAGPVRALVTGTAADLLLADGAPESRAALARVFANPRLGHESGDFRAKLLARCAAAGMTEPYRFYLDMLAVDRPGLPYVDDKGERVGVSYFEPTVAEEYAREVVTRFAPSDPAVKEVARQHPKVRDQVGPLREWLRSRLAAKTD